MCVCVCRALNVFIRLCWCHGPVLFRCFRPGLLTVFAQYCFRWSVCLPSGGTRQQRIIVNRVHLLFWFQHVAAPARHAWQTPRATPGRPRKLQTCLRAVNRQPWFPRGGLVETAIRVSETQPNCKSKTHRDCGMRCAREH